MSVYSVRFYAGTLPTNSLTTLYTVPTNKVAIIREIDVYCSTAGAIINFQGSGSGWLGIIYELLTVASSSWYQYAGRAVVDPGATLLGYSGVANTQAYVSGYLLDNL